MKKIFSRCFPLDGSRWLKTKALPERLTALDCADGNDFIYFDGQVLPGALRAPAEFAFHDYDLVLVTGGKVKRNFFGRKTGEATPRAAIYSYQRARRYLPLSNIGSVPAAQA